MCCTSDAPGINRHIEVLNGGIEPDSIFSVFHGFQYQNSARFLACLYCVIRALSSRLGPVTTKIKFNRMGIGHAVATGTIE